MEILLLERYALFRIGVQPSEWQGMTRWERQDLLYRHKEEQKKRVQAIRSVPQKKRFWALIQAALTRLALT